MEDFPQNTISPNHLPEMPLSPRPTKPSWWLFVILVVAILVGYGVLAANLHWWPVDSFIDFSNDIGGIRMNKKKNPITSSPTPNTPGWQTYKSEGYGFQIIIPPNWSILEGLSTVFFQDPDLKQRVSENDKNCFAKGVRSKCVPDLPISNISFSVEPIQRDVSNFQPVLLNNIQWKRYELMASRRLVLYQTNTGSQIFEFEADITDSNQNEQTLQQMLSAIQFIPLAANTITNWKTYTNAELAYSFEYPATHLKLKPEQTVFYSSINPTQPQPDRNQVQFSTDTRYYFVITHVGAMIKYSSFDSFLANGTADPHYKLIGDYTQTAINGYLAFRYKYGSLTYVWAIGNMYEIIGREPNIVTVLSRDLNDVVYDRLVNSFKILKSGNEYCIKVITPAKNPKTGEIRNFSTPCDIPQGWEVLNLR